MAVRVRPALVRAEVLMPSPPAGAAGGVVPPVSVVLNFFEDARFAAVFNYAEPAFSGGYAVSGAIAGDAASSATFVVDGPLVSGFVLVAGTAFGVRPAAGGLVLVSELDLSRAPPLAVAGGGTAPVAVFAHRPRLRARRLRRKDGTRV